VQRLSILDARRPALLIAAVAVLAASGCAGSSSSSSGGSGPTAGQPVSSPGGTTGTYVPAAGTDPSGALFQTYTDPKLGYQLLYPGGWNVTEKGGIVRIAKLGNSIVIVTRKSKSAPEVSNTEGSVPVWRLTDAAGGYAAWADGGKAVTWTLGAEFHRLTLADAIAFAEAKKAKEAKEAAESRGIEKGKKGKDKAAAADTAKKDSEPKVPKSEAFPIAVSVPRAAPEGVLALTNARVVTMNGDQILASADLVITGNRITAMGASGVWLATAWTTASEFLAR